MKTLRLTGAVLLAVTVLSLFVMSASAAVPPGSTPMSAIPVDNATDPIAAHASLWYKFDYSLDTINQTKPVVTLTLVNGTNSGVGFEIWAPNQINDMADNQPIGQGTAANVSCDTGEVSASGGCQSPNLTWSGALGSNGTYVVQVNNTNSGATQFKLVISGSGVKLAQQAGLAPAAPKAQPVKVVGNSPTNALLFDNQRDLIGASTSLWYKFSYALDTVNNTKPVVSLTLQNGTNSGIGFEIWSAQQINDMADNQPIGQGTAANVSCDTGEVSAAGGCQSVDLTWQGSFGATGVYFVQVNNTNSVPMSFNLIVKGSTVNLTPP